MNMLYSFSTLQLLLEFPSQAVLAGLAPMARAKDYLDEKGLVFLRNLILLIATQRL